MADEELTTGSEEPTVTETQEQAPVPGGDLESMRAQMEEKDKQVRAANAQARAERQKRAALQGQLESMQTPEPSHLEGETLTLQHVQQISQEAIRNHEKAAAAQTTEQKFTQRIAEAQKRHKDIDVAGLAQDETLPVSDAMAGVIKQDEQGADLLVWLSQNRDRAAEIAGLSPERAAVELGRIGASIKAPDPGSTISSAPDPINPIGGSGVASKDEDKMSTSELEAKLRDERGGSAFPKDGI